MNDTEMSQYITDTFKGVDVVNNMEASFFFYNPDPGIPPDHMFPFVTIVTSDLHDQFSNLNRPSVYRLNIGVSKQTFQALFGIAAKRLDNEADEEYSNYDFTTLDQLMPHPVYGRQYWVCILNPSHESLNTKVQPLLAEAYNEAVRKYDKKHGGDREGA